MKKLTGLVLLTLLAVICPGQEAIEVTYTPDFQATLNGMSLDNSTTYTEIVEMLGEPEVYKEYPTGKTNYRYTDIGFVFHTVNGKLLAIAFNFNWDGDKNFPNTTFVGSLKIGDQLIDAETTESVLSELDDLKIKCIIPGMCMNNPKEIRNPILLGFKDDMITQVTIEFH